MVHIVYFTASVNEKGEVIFRKDIYNRDAALRKALFKEYQN
jgi:murein L,D-transpeptidase YcbB/YkuD